MRRPTVAFALFALAVGFGTGFGACGGGSKSPDGGGTSGSGGGLAVGSVCDPADQPDDCLDAGLGCTPDYTGASPTGAFCQLPGAFYNCFPTPGCATNLECVQFDDAGDPGGCLVPCSTTADCVDPLTVCAPIQGVGATYCVVNNCANFWQPCPASVAGGTVNDGTCVYLYTDPEFGPEGSCLQGGSTPIGSPCNYYRGATASLCSAGNLCMPSAKIANSGVCLPACDAFSDGGPTCNADCVEWLPPPPPPAISLLDFDTQGGACSQDCTTVPTCPTGLTCQPVGPANSACLP